MSLQLARAIDPDASIPQCFARKNVFITGGSGFMGKALIEKLLRTCPEVGDIYVLVRPKRGKNVHERLQEITNNVLFDKLKLNNSAALDKLHTVEGDVREVALGMSAEDRRRLVDHVSIVFHVAATVRFDETLSDSIIMNTRGTREVCQLVLDLKHCDAFLHVSTAYCQHDKPTVDEVLYPNALNWREMITIAEKTDAHHLKILAAHLMHGYPNTYTLSKALAEAVIADLCQGKIPTIIIRPTIVVNAMEDPLPGWVDNMNGPVGLVVARSKGILRSTYVNFDARIDFIPVDVAINAFLKAVWLQQYLKQEEISVYNCASNDVVKVTTQTMVEVGKAVGELVTPQAIWYPSYYTTDSKFLHLVNIYLFHLLPAVLIDVLLRLLKKPLSLLKIQRKIFLALGSLDYFIRNQWTFRNEKFKMLDDYLITADRADYFIDYYHVDVYKFFLTAARVGIELIIKEKLSDSPRNYKIMKRMGYVHNTILIMSYISLIVLAINWILLPTCNYFMDYYLML